jgi:outer membrane protein assembly factor BamB
MKILKFLIFSFLLLTMNYSSLAQADFYRNDDILKDIQAHSGTALAVADMNGDLLDDLIFTDGVRLVIIAYQNINDKAFTLDTIYSDSRSIWSIAIADMDNDGRNDMMVCNSGDARIFLNKVDSFEEKFYDFQPVLEQNNLAMAWNKYVVDNNKLYFVSEDVGGGGTATVGILNIDTMSLEWKTNIEIEEGSYWIKEIRVANEKLYVHTQAGTLYILEKE